MAPQYPRGSGVAGAGTEDCEPDAESSKSTLCSTPAVDRDVLDTAVVVVDWVCAAAKSATDVATRALDNLAASLT